MRILTWSSAIARTLASPLICIGVASCMDGPYAFTNPYDDRHASEVSIVGGVDTLVAIDDTVAFSSLVSPNGAPFVPVAEWSSGDTVRLRSLGDGRFVVERASTVPAIVSIRAQLAKTINSNRSATRTVVIEQRVAVVTLFTTGSCAPPPPLGCSVDVGARGLDRNGNSVVGSLFSPRGTFIIRDTTVFRDVSIVSPNIPYRRLTVLRRGASWVVLEVDSATDSLLLVVP